MRKLGFLLALLVSIQISAQEKTDSLSLNIKQARAYALENNYSMQNARRDVTAAQKKVWETTAIGLPQVNGSVDYNRNLQIASMPLVQPNPATGVDTTVYIQLGRPQSMSAAITVSQLIFDGSYIVGLQSAITYKKISKLAEVKTETMVEEAVTNAYGNAVLSDETIAILENNVHTLKDNLKQIEAMYKQGLTEEQNVEQLQILLSTTENSLFKAKRNRHVAYQMLNYTLGMDINRPIKLENGVDFLLLENIDTTSIMNSKFDVEKNIDYAIQENQVTTQNLLKKLEQSKYLPSLSAFYQVKQDGFNDSFKFFSSEQDWFGAQVVGLKLNVPIFSSFQRHSKVQQAKIELEKAKTKQEEVKQKLILDFENAKTDYLTSINNYFTAKKNMELAAKIRHKEEVKFFEGMSSSIDLSNADQQLLQTQSSYIGSIQALIVSKAKMDSLLKENNIEE